MQIRTKISSLALAFVLGSAVLVPALSAQDDRENSTPTAAIWDNSVSPTALGTLVSSGWRITNLKVVSVGASGPTFAAALVANSGAYSKGWWWYYDQTEAQVRSLLSSNGARPIDIEPYLNSGNLRYAVVMVSNAGSDAKPWWWITNTTTTGIGNAVSANSARVFDMDTYTYLSSSYYSAILYSNTGSNSRGWWYYFGLTSAQLGSSLSTNSARLIDVQRVGTDSYNAVMYQLPDKRWYATGSSASGLTDSLTNLGARIVCLDPYTSGLTTTFTAGLTDNLNDESRRINDLMRATSDGYVGGYFRRANGTTSIAFSESRVFEPASTLKTLHHVMTMRRVYLGTYSLTQNLTVYTGLSGSCPNDTAAVTESLEVVLGKMMGASDNTRTKAITTLLGGGSAANGLTVLDNGAGSLGMGSTHVNHHIGCGSPPNETTLVDLADLHQLVVNGYLATQRQKFYDLMVNDWNGSGYALGKVGPVVDSESVNVGLTATQKAAFSTNFFLAGKRGGYGTGTGYHHTWAGYFKVPYYSVTQGVSFQEYVGGAFCGSATNDSAANEAASTGAAEVLRAQIRTAMLTWKNYVGGAIAYFGAGCTGSAGVPLHSATGNARVGDPMTYALSSARASTPVVLYFGGSKTTWSSTALPLNLAFAGAPGCYVNVALTVGINGNTNSSGASQVVLNVPVNSALIGGTIYSQHIVADAGANALSVVTTRGAAVTFGSATP